LPDFPEGDFSVALLRVFAALSKVRELKGILRLIKRIPPSVIAHHLAIARTGEVAAELVMKGLDMFVYVLNAVACDTSDEDLRTVLEELGEIFAEIAEVNCQGGLDMGLHFFAVFLNRQSVLCDEDRDRMRFLLHCDIQGTRCTPLWLKLMNYWFPRRCTALLPTVLV
jgi:hypothetical protein